LWQEATVLFAHRAYRRAISIWRRVLALAPSARARYNLALCYDETGAYVKAYRAFEEALSGGSDGSDGSEIGRAHV